MPVKVRQGCVNACYYARSRECDCACGGANHQRAFTPSGGVTRVIAMNDGFYKLSDVGNESDSVPAAGGIPPEALAKVAEEASKYRRFQDRKDASLEQSYLAHQDIADDFNRAADRLEDAGDLSDAVRARDRADLEAGQAQDRFAELNRRREEAESPADPTREFHRQRAEQLRAGEALHRKEADRLEAAGRAHKAADERVMADAAGGAAARYERAAGIAPPEPGTATRLQAQADDLAAQAAQVRQERERRDKRAAESREADRKAREAAADRDRRDAERAAQFDKIRPDERQRLEAVVAAQRANGTAAHMAAQSVVDRTALDEAAQGVNATYKVELADGTIGYQKPAGGAAGNGAGYQVTAIEQVTHEAAAYHLAQAMGEGYDGLVPPTVIVDDPELGLGSIQQHAGATDAIAVTIYGDQWENQIHEDQLRHAALFDAVIGHQDRHAWNWRVTPKDSSGRRGIALIDNGYAFARSRVLNKTGIVDWRNQGGLARTRLDASERGVLRKLADSDDLCGIHQMVGEQRAAAMRERIEFMLDEDRVMDEAEIRLVSERAAVAWA